MTDPEPFSLRSLAAACIKRSMLLVSQAVRSACCDVTTHVNARPVKHMQLCEATLTSVSSFIQPCFYRSFHYMLRDLTTYFVLHAVLNQVIAAVPDGSRTTASAQGASIQAL